MHKEQMSESEGTFVDVDLAADPCKKCGHHNVTCKTWESNCGSFEDYKYTCEDCGHVWWVDGPDA